VFRAARIGVRFGASCLFRQRGNFFGYTRQLYTIACARAGSCRAGASAKKDAASSAPIVRRKRLAVARFWYEGNAFAPLPADLAAFERCEWASGEAALAAARGTATELGAVAAFADSHPEWEVVVLRCASALPAGPIDEMVFDRFAAELCDGLRTAEHWDAVYLSLHGAAITATRQTPDLDLVRLVRSLLPDVPLGASFDLHGNMPPEVAALLDIASVYRTHPHVDMVETAQRVLAGLVRCAEGELVTRRVLRNDAVLLSSFNMRTAAGPMRELEERARALTAGPIVEACVFGGFPYADTECTGASVFVLSDAGGDPRGREAARVAQALCDCIARLAPQFDVHLPAPEEAIARALASAQPGLIAVTDPADNPLSGGACDTPGLLRALLDARAPVPCVFASIADPAVVAAAKRAGIGAPLDVSLGARFGRHFGEPVRVRASVALLTAGVFRNSGPMATGVERRCGDSAVLRVADQPNVRIVVTSDVVPADDPAFYALHAVDASSTRLLCVKAKNHFRAGMGAQCSQIIDCDAPGPACLDLTKLPSRHRLRRSSRRC
jgi:microcystin degradation protein MlrC